MSDQHKRRGNRRRIWDVIVPPRKGLPDDFGRQADRAAQRYSFGDKRRAKRFKGNIQGAKMQRAPRFWTGKRILIALVVVGVIILVLRTR
jgi:hypothetical protein